MKGSQTQPNQRILLTGRFSKTILQLNPTNLYHQFCVLQLNCHNKQHTTLSALNNEKHHIALLFQEPWVYHHDFQPPTHQAWKRLTPTTNPATYSTNSQNLTEVEIDILLKGINQKLIFFALYNPPCTFGGLQELEKKVVRDECQALSNGNCYGLKSPSSALEP
ncbi:hypothetical protein O181_111510 [Austropuccinia psidii MF-1]|uniref:Uncharacterized protein n=1 Tax=Austropuccinia psidii MF-1 TaxID=1389203 RepID=A0A9Q3K2J5_9BASI|nr:hypothetical protein [Austropuccinia psidii MF-1]